MTRRATTAERARYAFMHEVGICAVTGREGDIHAAHLRGADALFGKPLAGMANKPHWVWTVPLLVEEHLSQHRQNEKTWWAARGFGWMNILTSPLVVALALEGFRSMDDADGARTWLRERANGTVVPRN